MSKNISTNWKKHTQEKYSMLLNNSSAWNEKSYSKWKMKRIHDDDEGEIT